MTTPIYHINEARWDRIRAQGYPLGKVGVSTITDKVRESLKQKATTIYHFIDGEHGLCATCGEEFDSLKSETPAQLEAEKTAIPK